MRARFLLANEHAFHQAELRHAHGFTLAFRRLFGGCEHVLASAESGNAQMMFVPKLYCAFIDNQIPCVTGCRA